MKIKEAAEKYNLDENTFYSYVTSHHSDSISRNNFIVPDKQIDYIVHDFRVYLSNAQQDYLTRAAEEQIKQKAMAEMLITSGFTFDGYTITKYSGYISGDDATQIPRTDRNSLSFNDRHLTDALVKIRRQALIELKEAAYNLGCNAIIGVDFDYITLEPETVNSSGGTSYEPYVICVTANGNAVVIEKNQTNVTQAFDEQNEK